MKETNEKVMIYDKAYAIQCPNDKREALHRAGELVDQKLRDAHENNPSLSHEKLAILVAVNFAYDSIYGQSQPTTQQKNTSTAT